MPRTQVREVKVKVPVELLARARRKLGGDVTASETLRRGLALVAGADPAEYPVPLGRPAGTRNETAA